MGAHFTKIITLQIYSSFFFNYLNTLILILMILILLFYPWPSQHSYYSSQFITVLVFSSPLPPPLFFWGKWMLVSWENHICDFIFLATNCVSILVIFSPKTFDRFSLPWHLWSDFIVRSFAFVLFFLGKLMRFSRENLICDLIFLTANLWFVSSLRFF